MQQACRDGADDTTAPGDGAFPGGFHWGATMAGSQVDPGGPSMPAELSEDRASDRRRWVTDPEPVADGGTHGSGEPRPMALAIRGSATRPSPGPPTS